MGNSGFVTSVGCEKVGTTKSTRWLSAAMGMPVTTGCAIVLDPPAMDGALERPLGPAPEPPPLVHAAVNRATTTHAVNSLEVGRRFGRGRRVVPSVWRGMFSSVSHDPGGSAAVDGDEETMTGIRAG
jgi:hypothetical protein